MNKIDLDKVSQDAYATLKSEYDALMSYAADKNGEVGDNIKRAVVKCSDAMKRYDDMFKVRRESNANAIAKKWSIM